MVFRCEFSAAHNLPLVVWPVNSCSLLSSAAGKEKKKRKPLKGILIWGSVGLKGTAADGMISNGQMLSIFTWGNLGLKGTAVDGMISYDQILTYVSIFLLYDNHFFINYIIVLYNASVDR